MLNERLKKAREYIVNGNPNAAWFELVRINAKLDEIEREIEAAEENQPRTRVRGDKKLTVYS